MANTGRDVTAVIHGADSWANPLASTRFPFPESVSSTSTTAEAKCQEVAQWAVSLPILLLFTIDRTIALALALHAITGGATISLCQGSLAGQARYAVSIYPDRTLELPSRPSHAQLFNFIVINLTVLLLPGHAIGIWMDTARHMHILDVVVCPTELNRAVELGSQFNQRSIFDLAAERELSISNLLKLAQLREVEISHV